MALKADYRNIKGFKYKCYRKIGDDYYVDPKTQSLALATVYIGISEISENTIDEFWRRLDAWQRAFGPMCSVPDNRTRKGWREHRLSYKDLRNHIGLETNAATKTNAAFNRRLIELMRRESEYAAV